MNERWPPSSTVPASRVLLAVVASVLVTTAAVSGGGVALATDADSDASATPATGATEAQNQSLPPGTSEAGITNPAALLDAHDSVLRNTTYTERLRVEVRASNQTATAAGPTTGPVTATVRNGSTGTNATITARESHSEYWTTDGASAEYSRSTAENATSELYTYENGSVSHLDAGPSTVTQIQRRLLSTHVQEVDYSYAGTVTRGDDTLHEFRGTADDASNLTAGDASAPVQRFEATLLVSERGVVRAASAVVERAGQNGTETTTTNYSVTGVGATTASEPAWVSAQLPQFDVRVTDDSRVVALEYTGGGATANGTLPPETGLFVFGERAEATARLGATLAPGDTLYLWNDSGTVGLQRSVNEAPAATDSFVSLGGTEASYLVSRFALASENNSTTGADTTIEVYLRNETAPAELSATAA